MRISDWSSDVCSSDLTVACDQVLLGNRGLLVEDVEQVEEELELADRQFPRVLGADVEGVVRRPGFTAHRTRHDPGIGDAAALVRHVDHFRPVSAVTIGRAYGREEVGQVGKISVWCVSLKKKKTK